MTLARPAGGRIKPETIEIAGRPTSMLRAGSPDRPAIILLHGFSGDMMTWQFNIGALARHHHVIALDLPGHGGTAADTGSGYWRVMVDWLAGTITALGIERPHLIGHSLGARVALGLLEAGYHEARSLTMIACAGISPSYDYDFLRRLTEIATIEDALYCTRRLFGAARIDADRFARALHAKLSPAPARANLARYLAHNFAEGISLPASPVNWPAIVTPLQVIWGRDDRVVEPPPPGWLPHDAEIHLVDAVGHMPHAAAPDRVNALLLEFMVKNDRAP